MAEKRKDSKGRILKNGEYQKKSGQYEFRYLQGSEWKSVYSWRLVATDKTPPGKKEDTPLREKEKSILRDLEDGINSTLAAKLQMNELFEMYLSSKKKLSDKTKRKIALERCHRQR